LYYRAFGIKYKEAFPGSATVFVFLTDGYHLIQWIMTKCVFIAVATSFVEFLILWAVWSATFTIIFRRPKASE
jgi:hypothetical protein